MAAFFAAPLYGMFGDKIGTKYLYNFGAFAQGISAVCLGFLVFVDNTAAFLGLSYVLRFVSYKV